MPTTSPRSIEALDLQRRRARRPFDRRRRSHPLPRPPRHDACRQGWCWSAPIPPLMLQTDGQSRWRCRSTCSTHPRGARSPIARSSTATSSEPVLRRQPPRRDGVAGRSRTTSGCSAMKSGLQDRLRMRRGLLRNRLHRRPRQDRRAHPDRPRRRRPDRADRQFGAQVGDNDQGRDAQGLRRRPARPAAGPQERANAELLAFLAERRERTRARDEKIEVTLGPKPLSLSIGG